MFNYTMNLLNIFFLEPDSNYVTNHLLQSLLSLSDQMKRRPRVHRKILGFQRQHDFHSRAPRIISEFYNGQMKWKALALKVVTNPI